MVQPEFKLPALSKATVQAINGCKEGINLSSSMTQRAHDQGSLKGFLKAAPAATETAGFPNKHSAGTNKKATGGPGKGLGEHKQGSLQSFWNS